MAGDSLLEEQLDELEGRRQVFVETLKEFLRESYGQNIVNAVMDKGSFGVDFALLNKYGPAGSELADVLLNRPDFFFDLCTDALREIDLPKDVSAEEGEFIPTPRFFNIPDVTNIRDLRSRHINRFISTEGIVRRASEIRPEIVETVWECLECHEKIKKAAGQNFIMKPFECESPDCRNRSRFALLEKKKVDARWVTVEEPFDITEGDRPSPVNVLVKDDLTSPEGRRMTDPGNRIKINGVLKDVPKGGKSFAVKLEFYLDANHVEPTEIGWERIEISEEDEKEIKKLAKDPKIYEKLVASMAPSLYGLSEVKEGIILQLFGGVHRTLEDRTHFRGDIHILLIGDPSSGKSQLLKLVPDVIPRGRYVSGKGVTGAGLTATVTKDEQFMGGWVLEAGALVLSNKGLLSVDEFEKMSEHDQVAMHEALEQGTISIAKASIVASLPARTSVLAGGNPKFSRFDPYQSIAKQITVPDTLLSRFDLKFALKDVPNPVEDKKVVDHILKARYGNYEAAIPVIPASLLKKYIAYAKQNIQPRLTKETGKLLRDFYIKTRRQAEGGEAPIPVTLRQFESMIRLAEASAKIQLSTVVRKQDAQRAIRIMKESLRQLGLDPETGLIDVDKSEGGTSFSERSKIKMVIDIINDLSLKKKEVSIEELESRARQDGIDEVSEIIERLKQQGMLFEPSPGYVQKV